MIITSHAYARAGLVGNPSDGYFGKTIAFTIRNFKAAVTLWESPHFEIVPTHGDLARFDSVTAFLKDQRLHGYYGGMRLIKAAIKRFSDYCRDHNIDVPERSYTVGFETDIPRLVGLAGSSAIVVAMIRALMQFHEITIPLAELPTLAWAVEREELGINCGMQDRVVQNYEGMVYMDFDRHLMESRGYGIYEPLTPEKMPPLYIAYDPARAEVSDVPHRNLRELFNRGDPTVVSAMKTYRDITDRGRDALMKYDLPALGAAIDEGFNLRKTIMNIAPENLRMVDAARATGASATFAGSGGAIVGLYRDGRHYQQLVDALGNLRCTVIRPLLFDQ
jgi:glucuronokinase